MGEARARQRIRKAVESRGYAIEELYWEPMYYAGEGFRMAGGWYLQTRSSAACSTRHARLTVWSPAYTLK